MVFLADRCTFKYFVCLQQKHAVTQIFTAWKLASISRLFTSIAWQLRPHPVWFWALFNIIRTSERLLLSVAPSACNCTVSLSTVVSSLPTVEISVADDTESQQIFPNYFKFVVILVYYFWEKRCPGSSHWVHEWAIISKTRIYNQDVAVLGHHIGFMSER